MGRTIKNERIFKVRGSLIYLILFLISFPFFFFDNRQFDKRSFYSSVSLSLLPYKVCFYLFAFHNCNAVLHLYIHISYTRETTLTHINIRCIIKFIVFHRDYCYWVCHLLILTSHQAQIFKQILYYF